MLEHLHLKNHWKRLKKVEFPLVEDLIDAVCVSHTLEMYVDAGSRLPDVVKNLIISCQLTRNDGTEETPMKKKKL